MIRYDHEERPESLRHAAIMVAENSDVPTGQRWRLVSNKDRRTVIREVPLAALWVARSFSVVLRLFGNRIAVIDWTSLPERVRVDQNQTHPEEQRTDDEILADRTADLLWANRHALRIVGGGWTMRPDMGSVSIALPGDVDLQIDTRLSCTSDDVGETRRSFTLRTANVTRRIEDKESPNLEATWRAIIGQRILDSMEPGRTTLTRRSDTAGIVAAALSRVLEKYTPPLQEGTYMGTLSKYEFRERELPSAWREVSEAALYCETTEPLWNRRVVLVSDGVLDSICVDIATVRAAESRRATRVIEDAMSSTPPVIAGPSVTGSPKAAIMARLLRDALARQPDLADRNGTPIEPLLTTHLPRLLDVYVRMRSDPEGDHALADEQLEKGLARIGAGLDDALRSNRSGHGDDIRVEVAFLTARHPEQDGLDPLDDAADDENRAGER